jgi:protein-tyrosine phosphatase
MKPRQPGAEDHGHSAEGFKGAAIDERYRQCIRPDSGHGKTTCESGAEDCFAARGKVFLLGKWQSEREIQDPYRQGKAAFIHAHALIEDAVSSWAQRLGH